MAEDLQISTGSKIEQYESLLPQIKALTEGESDFVANCANIAAALRQTFGFFWVGFYFVKNHDQLVLGPFQGDIACTRINLGKGVCGTSWQKSETIIVDDVDQFPGHIACSSSSRSEIVVPIFRNDIVIGVLDVDSDQLADFDETDKIYLERLALMISDLIDA
ncbi:MAG: GAF domain-containing protein [Crocinitomicaceae bacterium]|nr:GAF domain-containing protein [Crocinitomicaceae bacterium]